MSVCNLCPRRCGADRSSTRGVCRMGEKITLARAALHGGEEPCLAPNGKSGAVFFSGCSLGCVFCQNAAISSARSNVTLQTITRAVEFITKFAFMASMP